MWLSAYFVVFLYVNTTCQPLDSLLFIVLYYGLSVNQRAKCLALSEIERGHNTMHSVNTLDSKANILISFAGGPVADNDL